jgi:hypothetical protein
MTLAVNIAQGGSNNVTMRNRIINGAMVIDQRNAGASVTPSGSAYTLDRWYFDCSQASKMSVQQTPSATETGYATRVGAGFTNYIATTTVSPVSIGAGDFFWLSQFIEGFNIADLAWGTSSAKTVTLSFWAYSSLTGTFGGALQNSDSTRSYPFSYTISSANTWTQISVTIAGDTSGTWLTTNGKGIRLSIGLGVGSTRSGTAGAWAGTNYASCTGATSVVGTNGATFYLTGVQLEAGTTASPFEYRQYTTELQLCERYFEKSYNMSVVPGTADSAGCWSFYINTGTAGGFSCAWRTRKRTVPTVTVYSTGTGAAGKINGSGSDQTASVGNTGEAAAFIYSGATTNNYWQATASAEL